MKIRLICFLLALCASAVAAAADSTGKSPMDRNQACMDRTVDSSSGDCIIKDDGTPRQTYPPKRAPAQPAPKPAATAPFSTTRGSSSSR
jgi:hypothetical protein